MADYDGSIRIKAEIDSGKAEKQLGDLSKSASNISDGFEDAEAAGISFGDVLKANVLSDAIISGFHQLTDALGGFISGSVSTAAELKAEVSQYEQSFGQMEDVATEAISGISEQTGILDTRLRGAATSIYSFARASGGTESESMTLMEDALTAAADAAAYYDRSLDTTTEQLMSFLKGNYENDAALGLSATETTRNAAAMEAFGTEFNNLSEIQKQQVLLKMVTDAQALSGAMGQASRESDGLENVMGNLSEVGRQIQGNIGAPVLEAIIPSIQEITNALIGWTDGVDWTAFSDAVSGFISGLIDNGPTIVSIIAGIGAGFLAWKATTMIQSVVSAVSTMIPALTGATGAQTGLNAAMSANPVGLVVTAITSLVTIIMTLWTTNEDFRDAVTEIWGKIKDAFLGAWEGIKEAWGAASEFFTDIWSSIETAFSSVTDYLSGVFEDAWEGVKAAWGVASAFFTAIWAAIKTTFDPVLDYLSGIFEDAWENVKQTFAGVIDFIAGVFTGDWKRAWNGVKGIFTGVWNGIVSALEGAVNLIIKGINWMISQLNKVSFTIPDWVPAVGGNKFGFNIPRISEVRIPRLAAGAVIPPNREFLAVLGDQSSGTNVEAPLSTIEQAVENVLARSGGMNSGPIEVKLVVDSKTLARVVVPQINNMTRQAGKSVLLY